jgi:hypothetical protein
VLVSRSSAASSPAPAEIPLLTVGMVGTVSSLDFAHRNTGASVAQYGLETLLNYGPTGQLVPGSRSRSAIPGRTSTSTAFATA